MAKVKSPASCHPDRPIQAKGLCNPCYSRQLRTGKAPAKCHPEKPEYEVGSGMCSACYQQKARAVKPPSSCHPENSEYLKGSGICQNCYNGNRLATLPLSTCHPDRVAVHKKSRLCQTCYDRKRLSEAPRASCHPAKPVHNRKTGLCKACCSQLDRYGKVVAYEGACGICGDPICRGTGKSAVDHDHKTGVLRGVLCGSCNKMLGFARDNISILEKAITYLAHYAKRAS